MQTYVCGRRRRGATAAIAAALCATCLLNAVRVLHGHPETVTAVPDVGGGGPQLLSSLQPPTTTAQHQPKSDDSANTELLKQVIRKIVISSRLHPAPNYLAVSQAIRSLALADSFFLQTKTAGRRCCVLS
uniref:Uncharacterized protein n=1 Tax=Schizaphis graminum TaxID=13262 RepID=A0A2S2PFM4_SCHGA